MDYKHMTIDKMTTVLEAFKRGEKIEYSCDDGKSWKVTDCPVWNFSDNQYRIAKPVPKKVKLEAWFIAGELRWFNENSQFLKFATNPIRVPAEDKEIEL